MKTGSDFCSDEHLELHRKETMGRLMDYGAPEPAHSEDPIHRLAAMGGHGPAGMERSSHQPLPFVGIEVRRQSAEWVPLWRLEKLVIPPAVRLARAQGTLRPIDVTVQRASAARMLESMGPAGVGPLGIESPFSARGPHLVEPALTPVAQRAPIELLQPRRLTPDALFPQTCWVAAPAAALSTRALRRIEWDAKWRFVAPQSSTRLSLPQGEPMAEVITLWPAAALSGGLPEAFQRQAGGTAHDASKTVAGAVSGGLPAVEHRGLAEVPAPPAQQQHAPAAGLRGGVACAVPMAGAVSPSGWLAGADLPQAVAMAHPLPTPRAHLPVIELRGRGLCESVGAQYCAVAMAAATMPASMRLGGSVEATGSPASVGQAAAAAGPMAFVPWKKEAPSFRKVLPALLGEGGRNPWPAEAPSGWRQRGVSLPAPPPARPSIRPGETPRPALKPASASVADPLPQLALWPEPVKARSDGCLAGPAAAQWSAPVPIGIAWGAQAVAVRETGHPVAFQAQHCRLTSGSTQSEPALLPFPSLTAVIRQPGPAFRQLGRLSGLDARPRATLLPVAASGIDIAMAMEGTCSRAPREPAAFGHRLAWRQVGTLGPSAPATAPAESPLAIWPAAKLPPASPGLRIEADVTALALSVNLPARAPARPYTPRLDPRPAVKTARVEPAWAVAASSAGLGPCGERPPAAARLYGRSTGRWIGTRSQTRAYHAPAVAAALTARQAPAVALEGCGFQAARGELRRGSPTPGAASIRRRPLGLAGRWQKPELTVSSSAANTLGPRAILDPHRRLLWPEQWLSPVMQKTPPPTATVDQPTPVVAPVQRATAAESPFGLVLKPTQISPEPAQVAVNIEPVAVPPEPVPVAMLEKRPVRPAPQPKATIEPFADSDVLRAALERKHKPPRSQRLRVRAAEVWEEYLKPALEGKPRRVGIIVTATLMLLVLLAGSPRNPVGAGMAALSHAAAMRSYYLIEDDFSKGLDAWSNSRALLRQPDGSVEVKEGLSLYTPSDLREDYEFSFSGWVRQGSLNWVVRASSPGNHYAFKLMRKGKGKDRRSVLVRYAVIGAEAAPAEKNQATVLPFELEENRVYRVTVQVSGDQISTLIDDRGVDSYSDARLKSGGVGFFAEKGETCRIRSMSITGHPDAWGRTIAWVSGFYRFLFGS